MAIPDQVGYFDTVSNLIKPPSSDTWTNHEDLTWGEWRTWDTPGDTITWYAPVVDLGAVSNFTLNITTLSTGDVSYKVYTSNTGIFAGEETETVIAHSASSVGSFSGQYVLVVVTSEYVSTELNIATITVTPQASTPIEILYKDLDTSTLAGTSTARTIPLTQTVSQILEIFISPKTVTAYNLDVYVSSTATSTYVIPHVLNKNISGPEISLIGVDNKPRDAVVDVLIKALGGQKMSGNNLVTN